LILRYLVVEDRDRMGIRSYENRTIYKTTKASIINNLNLQTIPMRKKLCETSFFTI
jgi:hypothetical protein